MITEQIWRNAIEAAGGGEFSSLGKMFEDMESNLSSPISPIDAPTDANDDVLNMELLWNEATEEETKAVRRYLHNLPVKIFLDNQAAPLNMHRMFHLPILVFQGTNYYGLDSVKWLWEHKLSSLSPISERQPD